MGCRRRVGEVAADRDPGLPGSAGGIAAFGNTFQSSPPSRVDRIRNLPFTGSLSTGPCRGLKNALVRNGLVDPKSRRRRRKDYRRWNAAPRWSCGSWM